VSLSERLAALRRLAPLGAVIAPLGVAAALVPLRHQVAAPASALILVAVVAGVSAPGRRLLGFLATVSAALFFDLWLTQPYGHLEIADRTQAQCSVALLVVGAVVSEIGARGRRYWVRAADGRRQLVLVAEVAAVVAAGEPLDGILTHANAAIGELLFLQSCRFAGPADGPPGPRVTPSGEVLHVGVSWAHETIGLPGPEVEVPVSYRGREVGRFVGVAPPGPPVGAPRPGAAAAIGEIVGPAVAHTQAG
jgi:hypothetical protein